MANKQYTSGDSIRITGEFKDYDGNNVTPTDIELNIYDSRYKLVETLITFDNPSAGVYVAYYTTPSNNSRVSLIIEWKGYINGLVNVYREKIEVDFV